MSADQKVWLDQMKAEALNTEQLDLWLQGKRSRRILVVPFSGPLPGGKAGLDLDGEYFDETTDLAGPFAILKRTRERLVDWHHDQDPTGVMKGAIVGRVTMDEAAEPDGLWGDFWANAGEKRRTLLAQLESRGVPLYGSSQSAGKAYVTVAQDGHIETWPLVRHTITTSPQNTHAVVPPLKGLLDTASEYEALTVAAFQAATAGKAADRSLADSATGANPGKAADRDLALLGSALDELTGYLLRR